jgi:hypothetical protein
MSLVISAVNSVEPISSSKSLAGAPADGAEYSLNLVNESTQPWIFYVYQTLPRVPPGIFSLAWFASPYMIRVGDQITFRWEKDYNFVWSNTGMLVPGVTFDPNGSRPCSPDGDNTTTFSLDPAPGLSAPVAGPPGALVIRDAGDVPSYRFSVGIGMSGQGTFAVQAGANLTHSFTPTPSYWIAAGANVRLGTVLSLEEITQKAEVEFPALAMKGTLGSDHKWTIAPA